MPEASADRRRGAVALGDDGEEDQGSATMLSSISGLTNTIIGAGMLALPHAYAKMGWLQGSLLVVLCAVVTNFGLYLHQAVRGPYGQARKQLLRYDEPGDAVGRVVL